MHGALSSIKPSATCSGCGRAPALSLCSGCLTAAYCDAVCQRREWKTHKPVCKDLGVRALAQLRSRSDGKSRLDLGLILMRGVCGAAPDVAGAAAAWVRGAAANNAACGDALEELGGTNPGVVFDAITGIPSDDIDIEALPRLKALVAATARPGHELTRAAHACDAYSRAVNSANAGDFETAKREYADAADLGHIDALRQLGMMASTGQGGPRNLALAIDYFERALSAAIAANDTEREGSLHVYIAYHQLLDHDGTFLPLHSAELCAGVVSARPHIEAAWALGMDFSPTLAAALAIAFLLGEGAESDESAALLWMRRSLSVPSSADANTASTKIRQGFALQLLFRVSTLLAESALTAVDSLERATEAPMAAPEAVLETVSRFLRWAAAVLDTVDESGMFVAWRAEQDVLINLHRLAIQLEHARSSLSPSAAANARMLARHEAAAGAGHGCSAASLYVAYRDGKGFGVVARDESKAAHWAARTRELGHGVPEDGEGESH